VTAIFYPDCAAASDDGRLVLEARSPHNGTICHRDGRKPSGDEFEVKHRQHQTGFRYQLLDKERQRKRHWVTGESSPEVVWERWQGAREDSPGELLVSDDGWSVIRTHGFAPEVIAVAPDGRDGVRVRVAGWSPCRADETIALGTQQVEWCVAKLISTTAGDFWANNSWRYFFDHNDEPYLVWRPWWGQRLVLDLGRGVAFTDESQVPPELAAAVVTAERRSVQAFLQSLSPRMAEIHAALARPRRRPGENAVPDPLMDRVAHVTAALNLVGVHRLQGCVPHLREWEEVNSSRWSGDSSALFDIWCYSQRFRPIAHHALKLCGDEPKGYSTYCFARSYRAFLTRKRRSYVLPMAERLPDRGRRAAELDRDMSAEEVLRLIGSPDHIRQRSRKIGPFYKWSEEWEYDELVGTTWTTLRIIWDEVTRPGCITCIESVPTGWLDTDERVREFFTL
jgi:hypothetical protein